jgi:hypothetical protein
MSFFLQPWLPKIWTDRSCQNSEQYLHVWQRINSLQKIVPADFLRGIVSTDHTVLSWTWCLNGITWLPLPLHQIGDPPSGRRGGGWGGWFNFLSIGWGGGWGCWVSNWMGLLPLLEGCVIYLEGKCQCCLLFDILADWFVICQSHLETNLSRWMNICRLLHCEAQSWCVRACAWPSASDFRVGYCWTCNTNC